MHPNYEFLLKQATASGGRILDYGCGAAEIVRAGLDAGLDIYGAEAFYEGGSTENRVTDLLGSRVFRIENDRTPYRDGHFDPIFSNQVLDTSLISMWS